MQGQRYTCIPRFTTWINSKRGRGCSRLGFVFAGTHSGKVYSPSSMSFWHGNAVPVKDGSQCRGSGFLGRGYTNGKDFEWEIRTECTILLL